MPNNGIRPRARKKCCAYCDRTFTKEEHLKRHQRSHTGEKPFKCHRCGRSYARSDVLARHLQTHSINTIGHISSASDQHKRGDIECREPSISLSAAVSDFQQIPNSPTCHPLLPTKSLLLEISSSSNPTNTLPSHSQQNEMNSETGAPMHPPTSSVQNATKQPSPNVSAHAYQGHAGVLRSEGPQTSLEQPINDIPSPFIFEENDRTIQFEGGQDVTISGDYSIEQIPSPTGAHFSPDPIGFFDFSVPDVPFMMSDLDKGTIVDPPIAFSAEQLSRIRRLWPRRNPKIGARLIRDLWHQVVHHQADNIFSNPLNLRDESAHLASRTCQTSRWNMNDECKDELVHFCKQLDRVVNGEALNDVEMQSTPVSLTSEGSETSSWVSDEGFLTTELLDSSLDFFFEFFHPSLPFIHKSTFDARRTPRSLLLPMCLVGLSSMDPSRTRSFVLHCLKGLMVFCRSELTSKAVGQYAPWELLLALTSTLIVVYLALDHLDVVGECQAHMLCAQMLHIAEKHGLFAAAHGDDLTLQLQCGPSDLEGSWKAWARTESIKRVIVYFLWLDMAYTRLMNTAGVVEMEKVEFHLPCDDVLFDASTFIEFLHATKCGMQSEPRRLRISTFHTNAPVSFNHISIQTLIRALYLQFAATRTRLLAEKSDFSELHSYSPAEAFVIDSKAQNIVTSLLLVQTLYGNLVQGKNAMTALAWNELCLALTADIDVLEVASGRDGLEAASTALVDVAKWSQSASARRAILHAAQVFDILGSSRVWESNIAKPDTLLFDSALALSLYLFVNNPEAVNLDAPAFELLQKVDWTVVNGEGILKPTENDALGTLSGGSQGSDSPSAARDFIRYGGPISIAGDIPHTGGIAARKVLRRYARLLDDFGKSAGERYSQLLKIMSDFVIKDS